MAKKIEKKERKLISTLTNLQRVDEDYNSQSIEINKKDEENENYNIQIRLHQNWIDKFRRLHINFLGSTEKYKDFRYLMNFFTMVVLEFIEDLKSTEEYYESDNKFIEYISRKGQRKRGNKTINDKEKTRVLVIGTYRDEYHTKKMWQNLIYSIAKKENMENMLEYSTSYFFIDLIEYIEKNKEKLIEKYK